MTVRPAVMFDRTAIVRMGCRFIAESSYRGQLYPNPEAQARLAEYLIGHGGMFVADVAGELVGMLGLIAVPLPSSGEIAITECAWWVEPEWRRSSAAGRLFYAGEKWAAQQARALGLDSIAIQMIAPFGSRDVEEIYRRRGYLPLETTFQKRLQVAA